MRVSAMLTRPWLAGGIVAALVLAMKLPFVDDPLGIDESGYLVVARDWHAGGSSIYGDLWLDRPPLLLAIYRGVSELSSAHEDVLLRCLGVLLTLLVAGLSARAAWRITESRRASFASALVAGALGSSVALRAQSMNAELPAVVFVCASIACLLEATAATAGSRSRLVWSAAAGCSGACAMFVKQNFAGGLVFAAALGAAAWCANRRQPHAPQARTAAAVSLALGAAVPVVLTLAWAASRSGPGVEPLFDALVTFRTEALATINEQSSATREARISLVLRVAFTSGIAPILLLGAVTLWRHPPRTRPVVVAWYVTTALTVFSIALSGSWWRHYLIQLIPMTALATGLLVARRSPLARIGQLGVALVVVAACTNAGIWLADDVRGNRQQHEAVGVGESLAAASRSGDSVVVFGGHANALERSELTTPYPYLWSLPMRVLDPDLALLRRTLRGPEAPTWVVIWNGRMNPWGIDDDRRFARTLAERYRRAGTVCNERVLVRRDVTRPPVRDAAVCR